MRSARVAVAVLLVVSAVAVVGPSAQAAEPADCDANRFLDVSLVIDRSGSMDGEAIEAARTGSRQLVENLTRDDQSGLVSYSSSPSLDQPLGFDHDATIAEIEDLVAGGSTATGDAIDLSHDDIRDNRRQGTRQVMIVLTDGFTNTGSDPVIEAQEAKDDGVEIFAIGLGDSVNEQELREVASDPVDDHFFHPQTTDALVDVFANLTGALSRRPAVAESYTARAEIQTDDGAKVAVSKVNQQRLPNGSRGDIANVSLSAGGFEVEFVAGDGEADGGLTEDVAHAHAVSRVKDLTVRAPDGTTVLGADALVAESRSRANGTNATSTAGDTHAAGLTVAGQSVSQSVPPDTTVPFPGGEVTLNEQNRTRKPGASGLSVRMVNLTADVDGNATLELTVGAASSGASCGVEPVFEPPRRADGEVEAEGPGGGEGYTAHQVPVAWTDIRPTGIPVSLCDDCLAGPIPIGFNHTWYGRNVSQFWISSNGFLTFSEQFTSGCCSGRPLPTSFRPFDMVAGWWSDLEPREFGLVQYQTVGEAPSRVLIVQFTAVPHYPAEDPVTFQFKVFEADGAVEVHHLDAPTDGSDHTIGVQNADGSLATEYFHGSDKGFTRHAVRFQPAAQPPSLPSP